MTGYIGAVVFVVSILFACYLAERGIDFLFGEAMAKGDDYA